LKGAVGAVAVEGIFILFRYLSGRLRWRGLLISDGLEGKKRSLRRVMRGRPGLVESLGAVATEGDRGRGFGGWSRHLWFD
jgi:hypothetical protein